MGGKVLVPTRSGQQLIAARLAADVCNVPTVLVARTDAEGRSAHLGRRRARPPLHRRGRTSEGFCCVHAGLEQAIARGRAYAPTRTGVVRDRPAGPGRARGFAMASRSFRDAGLQLLALLQLEEEAG